MLTIETCPYRCNMYWYAAVWNTRVAHVFNTKAEAVAAAREINKSIHKRDIVNVGWIENSMGRIGPENEFEMRKGIGMSFKIVNNCLAAAT